MADKLVSHPSKPTATKPQIYSNNNSNRNAARPVYRSHPHRYRRSCCCYCCLWIIFIIMLFIIISAIAAAVMFLLFRPHRPSFSVSNLQISTQSRLFNLTVIARNPNNKMTFYYDPVSVSIESNGVSVGDGSIPAFVAAKKSTTTLRAVVNSKWELKEEEKKKSSSLVMKIKMNANVRVKIGGSYESKKALVRVVCDGIKEVVDPSGESSMKKNSNCKVDLRIKIWKWTL
ncbi:hypothetical protein SSX86_015517 [Deinandra increscens subsp. villosa]|uniref:Late embryogenesis abundant protein LEA-2 subgroup domain-containing protein n=1 Tax=Deinandra increscens subsp. villosa TaxID=3103831 RepID=A0AAP0CZY9_9ASTR